MIECKKDWENTVVIYGGLFGWRFHIPKYALILLDDECIVLHAWVGKARYTAFACSPEDIDVEVTRGDESCNLKVSTPHVTARGKTVPASGERLRHWAEQRRPAAEGKEMALCHSCGRGFNDAWRSLRKK